MVEGYSHHADDQESQSDPKNKYVFVGSSGSALQDLSSDAYDEYGMVTPDISQQERNLLAMICSRLPGLSAACFLIILTSIIAITAVLDLTKREDPSRYKTKDELRREDGIKKQLSLALKIAPKELERSRTPLISILLMHGVPYNICNRVLLRILEHQEEIPSDLSFNSETVKQIARRREYTKRSGDSSDDNDTDEGLTAAEDALVEELLPILEEFGITETTLRLMLHLDDLAILGKLDTNGDLAVGVNRLNEIKVNLRQHLGIPEKYSIRIFIGNYTTSNIGYAVPSYALPGSAIWVNDESLSVLPDAIGGRGWTVEIDKTGFGDPIIINEAGKTRRRIIYLDIKVTTAGSDRSTRIYLPLNSSKYFSAAFIRASAIHNIPVSLVKRGPQFAAHLAKIFPEANESEDIAPVDSEDNIGGEKGE